MLLLPLLLFLAACGSGGAAVVEQSGVEEVAPQPTTAEEPTATVGADEAATAAPESATADDPLHARERDWKLGDLVDPAVTIIEYGDFQ